MTLSLPSLFVGASCRNVSPVESNDSVFACSICVGKLKKFSPVERNDSVFAICVGKLKKFSPVERNDSVFAFSICGGKL